MEQGIPVIAVEENRSMMRNDLDALPWREGQMIRVANYWEAAGVMLAMRAGISLDSTRRPLAPVGVSGLDIETGSLNAAIDGEVEVTSRPECPQSRLPAGP